MIKKWTGVTWTETRVIILREFNKKDSFVKLHTLKAIFCTSQQNLREGPRTILKQKPSVKSDETWIRGSASHSMKSSNKFSDKKLSWAERDPMCGFRNFHRFMCKNGGPAGRTSMQRNSCPLFPVPFSSSPLARHSCPELWVQRSQGCTHHHQAAW